VLSQADWIEVEECEEEVRQKLLFSFVSLSEPDDDCHLPRSVLSTS
jgi:hypothetical protein